VAYAEQGRSREAIAHETVEARFGRLVDCRGRFVEKQPIGFLYEGAGKGNALLLTGRELEAQNTAWGRREIGHIHGDSLVDIPLPKKVRNELVTAGRAEPHHILLDSGWVSVHLRQASDVDRAIELLRFSFEIANQRTSK
jgi:hypothetical protein